MLKAELKKKLKKNPLVKILLFLRESLLSRQHNARYHILIKKGGSVSDIQVVSLEFSSVCNLNCRYCYLEKKDRPNFLSLDIYKKLLSEICKNRKYNIKIMEWPISGCFFLHPNYKEIIEITREHKGKYSNFAPWIILNDNMMLLDEEKIDFIFKQRVINQIICSIDGVDKETFEYMRPNADFEKVVQNTLCLLQKNNKTKHRAVIEINNGLDARCKDRKLDSRLKLIFNKADHVREWSPCDWNESFHTENPLYATSGHFCSFVFESVSLSTSGAITKCCMDLQELTKYGDFTKDSLESRWRSDTRKAFLQLMYEGKRHLIPGCSKCLITYVRQNKLPR